MKLKQTVCDGTTLNLVKEKKIIEFGEVFDVEDEERAKEILAATYQNKPVAELVKEEPLRLLRLLQVELKKRSKLLYIN